jgi:hypothetical protein
MKAGAVLNDLLRLAHFGVGPEVERFFVYLTDPEMLGYFLNITNGFAPLFSDQEPSPLFISPEFVASRAKSVQEKVCVPVVSCSVFPVLSRSVGQNSRLFVFFVQPD